MRKEGDDAQSGLVIAVDVQLRLAHAISGQDMPDWVSSKEVDWYNRLGVGSLVVHNNWLGQVGYSLRTDQSFMLRHGP